MQAESVLLEPWYDFRLEVPVQCVGRAMTDLQNMGGTVEPPENEGENAVLTGTRRCVRCATIRRRRGLYPRPRTALLYRARV